MKKVMTIILGGGAGSRLYPLTEFRAKPAVPLAGKYRLIDVPISNCINADMKKIFVLTQYLSASLNRHVVQAYTFDQFQDGFVEILAAEQRAGDDSWFEGTADAVRKHWATFENFDCDVVMILPGDALYGMNFRAVLKHHRERGADITVAVNNVPRRIAHHFGVLRTDEEARITAFSEKPKTVEAQEGFEASPAVLEKFGIKPAPGEDMFLASMGIYLFNRDVLDYYMEQTKDLDFGKHIIPASIDRYNVSGYVFDGYWEDIGTIEAFYEAHMQFLAEDPPFRFADPEHPIYSRSRLLPSTRMAGAHLDRSVVAEGCTIGKSTINHSIIGLRSVVHDHTTIEDSLMMGADFYQDEPRAQYHPSAKAGLAIGVGSYCHIKKAIIDKNARIGDNVKLLNEAGVKHADGDNYFIREGIIIVPKNAVIRDGTVV
jgi:glucose-1-phosphate adenylyltransferase